MASGKSGSFDLSGTKGFTVRVKWSETYDVSTNKSNVTIDELYVKSTQYSDTYYLDGSITINGTTAISFSSKLGTHAVRGATSFSEVVANGSYDPAPWTVSGISHNNDGSKSVAIAVNIKGYTISGTNGNAWGVSSSSTVALTTIPRKSTLSVSNGTLGTAQTLKVTRQSTSFTHTITAKCGSASTTICTKSTSTSISFTPPIAWSSQNTTGTSVSVTYTITTYNGNTSIGSNSYTKTCSIPSDVKPICSLTITDPTGYADKYGGYLKGLSKLKVVVDVTLADGSAIKSYKTTANGVTYTAASFTTGVLTKSGKQTVSTTVTDKRGRTGTASESVTVLDYSKPSIDKLTVHRCDKDGTPNDQNGEYIKVVFSGSVSPLSNTNTATYKLEYKKTTVSTYTSVELTEYADTYAVTDGIYIFEADTGASYNVRIIVTDGVDTGSKTTIASTGFTIMHWLASGLGMAIGKVSELANVLDIGFKTRFMGGILHPVLEPETDLNDVRTPNTYVGASVTKYNYVNCPLTTGTFTLEVVGMGEDGQVKQRITYCHRTDAKAWERIYYQEVWGEWICVSDFKGKLLWSGVYYMSASQTATLSEPISRQQSGIVLVFSRYSDSTARDYHFNTFFVPKYQIAQHTGCGHTFMMTTDATFSLYAAKYLYINDDRIVGNANNEATGTGTCGITYTNNGFVLRYVIGV